MLKLMVQGIKKPLRVSSNQFMSCHVSRNALGNAKMLKYSTLKFRGILFKGFNSLFLKNWVRYETKLKV